VNDDEMKNASLMITVETFNSVRGKGLSDEEFFQLVMSVSQNLITSVVLGWSLDRKGVSLLMNDMKERVNKSIVVDKANNRKVH